MYFMGCALFVAAMAAACNSNEQNAEDSAAIVEAEATVAEEATKTVEAATEEAEATIAETAEEVGNDVAKTAINEAGKKASEELTKGIQSL